MKKVLYIVSTLKRSGPMIVLANIVKYLDRDKFEPIVLTLSPEPKDSMKEYFENELKAKVETIGLSRIQGLFFAKSHVKKFIKENKIDIVHTHGFRADGLMSKISDTKSVSTLHNYPFYDYPMTYGKFQGKIMAIKHLNYLKKIDRAFVVSSSVSSMLRIKNNYEIDFIRNGTDTQRFIGLDKDELRKKLNIDKYKKVFISTGHLSSLKDPITIIEAFKKANLNDSLLIFLGDGELMQECKKEIENRDDILLRGRVENVHEYLGASDYFISSSLAEGLPNSVLEAMACGLPCILSNIPPHKEIQEINPDSSFIFNTKDINALSSLIQDIVEKDYENMSKASKYIIFNHLSAEIMSKNYQKVYSELLS